MDSRFARLLLFVLAIASGPVFADPAAHIDYGVDDVNVLSNPERGFFVQSYAYPSNEWPGSSYNSLETDFPLGSTWLPEHHVTVVRRLYSLRRYCRADTLPGVFLNALEADLEHARALGIKLNIRFAYTFDSDTSHDSRFSCPNPDDLRVDFPIARMERHIRDLGERLSAHAAVVSHVDAGMLGRYGEWYHGASVPTTTEQARIDGFRKRVVAAWLAALPKDRVVSVRTPQYKKALGLAAPPAPGQPLAAGFNGSDASRVGHYNDCFLSTDTDTGTYSASPSLRAQEYAYLAQETRFVPMSGETCPIQSSAGTPIPSPRSACAPALAEAARLHWSLLHGSYYDGIVGNMGQGGSWQAQGCFDDFARRLGYRFELVSAELPSQVDNNDCAWNASVRVRNSGFAAAFNSRPVYLVFEPTASGGGDPVYALISNGASADPRRWLPGETDVPLGANVPARLPVGRYKLHLWLPDPALGGSAYAIRFANEPRLWNAANGWNSLDREVTVNQACGGARADLRFDSAGGSRNKSVIRNSGTPVTFAWTTKNLPAGTTCRILLKPDNRYGAAATPLASGTRTDTAIQGWAAGRKTFYLGCSNNTISQDIHLDIVQPVPYVQLRFDHVDGLEDKTIIRNSGQPITFVWRTQHLAPGASCSIRLRPNDTYGAAARPTAGGDRTDTSINTWGSGVKRFYLRCTDGSASSDIRLTILPPIP